MELETVVLAKEFGLKNKLGLGATFMLPMMIN
jgi:hypothetical protein